MAVFGAIMLLPTPVPPKGNVVGVVILAAWYSTLQTPSWLFIAHTVVATATACGKRLAQGVLDRNAGLHAGRQ